ncbi:putative site-specific integrase-resolvase [Agromyces albus]|nr:putative site-specific integrase-resolvase [Agromyces albus]
MELIGHHGVVENRSPEKLAYTLPEAAEAVGVSLRTIQYEMASGDLRPVYVKTKPLLTRDELVRWLGNLPTEPKRASR